MYDDIDVIRKDWDKAEKALRDVQCILKNKEPDINELGKLERRLELIRYSSFYPIGMLKIVSLLGNNPQSTQLVDEDGDITEKKIRKTQEKI